MKSNPNGRSWNPTITLAKLYEEQNQFFDALAAYELIDQTESSPAIREKIEALHMRILSDPNSKYDPRIEKLFSPEELAYLKILNHSAFNNLSLIAEKLSDGFTDSENLLDNLEEDDFEDPNVNANDLQSLLLEIETHAQNLASSSSETLSAHTLQDFLIAMLTRFPKATPLSEISFADLISIFVAMQQGSSNPR